MEIYYVRLQATSFFGSCNQTCTRVSVVRWRCFSACAVILCSMLVSEKITSEIVYTSNLFWCSWMCTLSYLWSNLFLGLYLILFHVWILFCRVVTWDIARSAPIISLHVLIIVEFAKDVFCGWYALLIFVPF